MVTVQETFGVDYLTALKTAMKLVKDRKFEDTQKPVRGFGKPKRIIYPTDDDCVRVVDFIEIPMDLPLEYLEPILRLMYLQYITGHEAGIEKIQKQFRELIGVNP